MDLDSLIIAVFCLVDDALRRRQTRLRQRGPQPILSDSEVLCLEVVGEYLGLDCETAVFAYFRRHYGHFFPNLCRIHRTTFTRQAANLWKLKEELWQALVPRTGCDPCWALIDSFPVAVCRFARAPRSRLFRGVAGYGLDNSIKQIFYGFRLHARVCWPGVITRLSVAPGSVSDIAMLEELTDQTEGVCLADRAYWKPELHEWLRRFGLEMLVPYKKALFDKSPERAHLISSLRYRIETVFGQLCERFKAK